MAKYKNVNVNIDITVQYHAFNIWFVPPSYWYAHPFFPARNSNFHLPNQTFYLPGCYNIITCLLYSRIELLKHSTGVIWCSKPKLQCQKTSMEIFNDLCFLHKVKVIKWGYIVWKSRPKLARSQVHGTASSNHMLQWVFATMYISQILNMENNFGGVAWMFLFIEFNLWYRKKLKNMFSHRWIITNKQI